MRNMEVSVICIRYTSGRRGNVRGRILKASTMNNSANIIDKERYIIYASIMPGL